MSTLSALLQGILQGLTEFLPVSSSGHLSIFQYFTGINGESSTLFSILLHLGTLIAVFIAFYPVFFKLIAEFILLIKDIFTLRAFKTHPTAYRRMIYMFILSCLPLLLVLPFKDFISGLSSDNGIIAEGICFLITSFLLTMSDRAGKGYRNSSDLSVGGALGIGVAQAFATLPGVSRSGSTISAGLLAGLKREEAVQYSFILGTPAVLGAALLDFKDLSLMSSTMDISVTAMIVGVAASIITGILSIKLVQYIVKTDKFKIFAIYTFILGLITVCAGIVEVVFGNPIQALISSLI